MKTAPWAKPWIPSLNLRFSQPRSSGKYLIITINTTKYINITVYTTVCTMLWLMSLNVKFSQCQSEYINKMMEKKSISPSEQFQNLV